MADMTPGVCAQASEVNALNFKALYDDTISDISLNRKSLFRHQDAWETLRLRNASFAASFDHALMAGMALSGQIGTTEGQAAVTPIRTGVADTVAAAAYPANRAVDTADASVSVAAADVATANASVAANMVEALSLLNQAIAALQGVVVTAAGGASTPSQTSPKPTS